MRSARTVLITLAVAAVAAFAAAPTASAAPCEATWDGPSTGSWFTAANWSTNLVPDQSTTVCIDGGVIIDAGYGGAGNASHVAESLTLGGPAVGGPVLRITSTYADGSAQSASLTLADDSTVLNDGVIELTSTTASNPPGQSELRTHADATITSSGIIRTQPGNGGGRLLELGLAQQTNGTLDILETTTWQGGVRTLSNSGGVINVANGERLDITGNAQGPTFNQNSGLIQTNTSGVLSFQVGTFNHNGGATDSASPPQICGARLNAPGNGVPAVYKLPRSPSEACTGGKLGQIGSGVTVRLDNSSLATHFVQLAEDITNEGSLILEGSGSGSIELSSFSLENEGVLQTLGNGPRLFGLTLNNAPGGTLSFNAGACQCLGNQAWTNSGNLLVAAGQALNFTGNASLTIEGGTVTTNGSIGLVNPLSITGGTLSGIGSVSGADVNHTGGIVAPGNSPGILTIDQDYAQGEEGILAIEVQGASAGVGHDELVVGGTATLGGHLSVDTTGFTPSPGQQFTILDAASVTGSFATMALSGVAYSVVVGPGDVKLVAPAGQNPPADSDGDGVPDTADNCDSQSGPASNGGCPVTTKPPGDDGNPAACRKAKKKVTKAKKKLRKLRNNDAAAKKIKKAKKNLKKAKRQRRRACS